MLGINQVLSKTIDDINDAVFKPPPHIIIY